MSDTHTLQITLNEQEALDLQLALTTFAILAVPDGGKVLAHAMLEVSPDSFNAFRGALMLAIFGGKAGNMPIDEGVERMNDVYKRLTGLGLKISDWHQEVLNQRKAQP